MHNYIHLQEQVLAEHLSTMRSDQARRQMLAQALHRNGGTVRHVVSILGSRMIALGMRLERVEQVNQVYQG